MAFSKPQVMRPHGGDASSASSFSDKVCSAAIFPGDARGEVWRCGGCKRSLGQNSHCLECDGCRSWVCIKCAKISVHVYEFVNKNLGNDSFKFLCKMCKGKFDDVFARASECPPDSDVGAEVLAESQVPGEGGSCQFPGPRLDAGVSSTSGESGETHEHGMAEQVGQLVRMEVEKVLEERREREKRKCNVVAFGMEEDGKPDRDKIRKLFRVLRVGPVSVLRFYRLGKKREGVRNERPLLVSLASVCEKREVVRAAPGLACVRGYERVFVRPDVSKERRQELRQNRASRTGTVAVDPLCVVGGSAVGPREVAAVPDTRGGPLLLSRPSRPSFPPSRNE